VSLVRAGFFRRLAAGLLDTLLGLVLFVLSAMWLVLGIWALRGLPRDTPTLLLLYAGCSGSAWACTSSTMWCFLGGCGQTVGRMALGIAVVRADGGPPGYRRALLRSLGNLLTALTLGLAGLVALFNREGRDLADLFSGTRGRPGALTIPEDRQSGDIPGVGTLVDWVRSVASDQGGLGNVDQARAERFTYSEITPYSHLPGPPVVHPRGPDRGRGRPGPHSERARARPLPRASRSPRRGTPPQPSVSRPRPSRSATTYNNFYEFGTDKEDPARLGGSLKTAALVGEGGGALREAAEL
jgi:uncharacterized RDD family membrane protein YckC